MAIIHYPLPCKRLPPGSYRLVIGPNGLILDFGLGIRVWDAGTILDFGLGFGYGSGLGNLVASAGSILNLGLGVLVALASIFFKGIFHSFLRL